MTSKPQHAHQPILDLAGAGYQILPLNGKVPYKDTNGSKDASSSPAVINAWAGRYKNCNWGIATGHEHPGGGYLAVIDIDPQHGGMESYERLVALLGPLPPTTDVITGSGGTHIYLRTNKPLRNQQARSDEWQGIDIRGIGGYVVCPPSIHPDTGQPYEWQYEGDIAWMPAAWETMLDTPTTTYTAHIEDVDTPVGEGDRNQLLASLAGTMRRRGMTQTSITAALQAENQTRCTPPLDPGEVDTIAKSISRYTPAPPADETLIPIDDLATAKHALADYSKAIQDDPNHATDPKYIPSLAYLHTHSPSEWTRIETMVANTRGVKISWIKTAIKAHIKAQRDAAIAARPTEPIDDAPIDLVMPERWRMRESGVYYYHVETGIEERILPCPLWITKRLHTIDAGTEKVELCWHLDNQRNTLIVDRSKIAETRNLTSLADYKLPVNSVNAGMTVRFLASLIAENPDRIPLELATGRTGWAGSEFYPYAAPTLTHHSVAQGLHGAFTTAGDYERWKESTDLYRMAYPLLRAQLAASFAAPLLKPLKHRNFFVHLWGDSGWGKSAAFRLALSVWGNPIQTETTWNTTIYALGPSAYARCDLPFGIGERQVAPYKLDVAQAVYMLAEGVNKIQGSKEGGTREIYTWRNIFLTNGEEPLTSTQGMEGSRTRVIEFEGRPVGDEHEARLIHQLAITNYGHAGETFIQRLLKRSGERIRSDNEKILAHLAGLPGANDRRLSHLSALAALVQGDWYSSVWVFGLDAALAWRLALEAGEEWYGLLETVSASHTGSRVYEWIVGWVAEHRMKFATTGQKGAAWVEDDDPETAQGFQYWGQYDVSKQEVWVLTSVLDRELRAAGFSYRSALGQVHRLSHLSTRPDGTRVRYDIRKKGKKYNVIRLPQNWTENG